MNNLIIYDEFTFLNEKKDFFKEHEIKRVSNDLGFSEKEQKWYGWSHRAICGFGVGSKVKKGDSAYKPNTKEDWIEDEKNFFTIGEKYVDKKNN